MLSVLADTEAFDVELLGDSVNFSMEVYPIGITPSRAFRVIVVTVATEESSGVNECAGILVGTVFILCRDEFEECALRAVIVPSFEELDTAVDACTVLVCGVDP